jgi:hypothetical protein
LLNGLPEKRYQADCEQPGKLTQKASARSNVEL